MSYFGRISSVEVALLAEGQTASVGVLSAPGPRARLVAEQLARL